MGGISVKASYAVELGKLNLSEVIWKVNDLEEGVAHLAVGQQQPGFMSWSVNTSEL